MSQSEEFKRRKRTRVGGPTPQGHLIGAVVFLGALLLTTMVVTASLEVPPAAPPAPPVASLPTPIVADTAAAPRLYLVGTHVEGFATSCCLETRRLAVLDLPSRQLAYSLDDVRDAALSADGTRLYALFNNRVAALAVETKTILWSLSLTPLAATGDPSSQPLLALTPDEQTLLIYRQEVDFYANTAHAWIEQIDLATQQHKALNISIDDPHAVDSIFVAADGRTLFLAGYNTISTLDLHDGRHTQLITAPTGLSAVMSTDRLRLYTVDRAGWIREYDTLSRREIRRIRLQEDALEPVGGSATLAIAPHNDRLALLVDRRGQPAIVQGERVESSAGQALLVVSLDDGTTLRWNDRSHYPQALAWGSDGEQLYFVEFGQIYLWQLSADRVYSEQRLGSDDTITRMLLGPPLPLAVEAATPTPGGGSPEPPTATPAATPTPLLQPNLAPFAWLWPLDGAKQSVIAFSRDGSARQVADSVMRIIPRPDQPPLLLRAPDQSHWALFDPATGISTALDLAVPPSGNFSSAPPFLLSPDGAQVAFITTYDPKPADALSADRQLVIADTATGAVTVVLDAGRWDQLVYAEPLAWAADGIYLSSTLERLSTGDNARAIWRVDPSAAVPELLVEVAERGANFQLNAAAGLLLYEPYPADLGDSSLHLRDLRSGAERILFSHGQFINRNDMQIAPDGRFVAYLQPGETAPEAKLNVYNVRTQTTQQLYSGRYQSWPYALRWSNAGARLHLHTFREGFPRGVEQELVWTLSDGWMGVPTRWRLPLGGFAPPPEQDEVELVSAERSLSLVVFQAHSLLQLYSAQPDPQLVVSIPLPDPWVQSSDAPQLRRDTRIVYAP
jgi:hypothetical protein